MGAIGIGAISIGAIGSGLISMEAIVIAVLMHFIAHYFLPRKKTYVYWGYAKLTCMIFYRG